jgi:hypothetical protein
MVGEGNENEQGTRESGAGEFDYSNEHREWSPGGTLY